MYIFTALGLASCRRRPLSSNVRLHETRMSVVVAPLNAEDTAAVRQLLIDGLSERWGAYDPCFNPDLEAFPQSYLGSLILVAKTAGDIVGTGTLRSIRWWMKWVSPPCSCVRANPCLV